MAEYTVGDFVILKKAHPCGSREWEIMRTGMDFRIKCRGCGRQVWLSRADFEKAVRKKVSI
ncbi:MAG TPA: DUF951 domain-containing protein [Clostridia bacterium]|jgi:hypothetical protein|nr:DUF951 domain-containing protein [Clostridia bacterium]